MRKKKAFTLIEMITTLAILGIAVSLTAVVVANMNNVQSASSVQYVHNKEVNLFNETVGSFASFVSLDNDDARFTHSGSTPTSVTFSLSHNSNNYGYVLSYNDSHLTVTNTYDGMEDYFKYVKDETFTTVSNVSFSYDDSIALLIANFVSNGRNYHFSYVVRALA